LEFSEANHGSTFLVEIAAQMVADSSWVKELKKADPVGAIPFKMNEATILEGVNVLLVDDGEDNQTIISLFLEAAGAHVDFANNGKEGVQMAMSGHYDAVLMDIQMPVMDGYEATATLRKQGYKTPIIALTAHAMKEERDRCLKAGCDDHMTKPIDRRKLISQIAHMVH
jgi:CheY-like chemotaxis protein